MSGKQGSGKIWLLFSADGIGGVGGGSTVAAADGGELADGMVGGGTAGGMAATCDGGDMADGFVRKTTHDSGVFIFVGRRTGVVSRA